MSSLVPRSTCANVNVEIDGDAAADTEFQSRIQIGSPDYPARFSITVTTINSSPHLIGAAINSGYFDAELVRSEVLVDRNAFAADIFLNLQSGPRYQFGEINFSQGILRDRLLFGYTDIKTGDPYNAATISRLYESLNGSTYFKTVSISTEPLDHGKQDGSCHHYADTRCSPRLFNWWWFCD